jgi:hypothetical protein
MAFLTVSNRVLANRGSLKQEIGEFTDDGLGGGTGGTGGDYQIQTKVGRIIFFVAQPLGTADNRSLDFSYNSATDAGAEDDKGVMHIESGADSGAA